MPDKLLVPLDFSTDSPPELAFALRLARALPAELILFHVIDYAPVALPVELPAGYPMPPIAVVREVAENRLARIARDTGERGVRTLVEVGAAAPQIVESAKREGVDQIVMGSHRHNAVSRFVLGSVADRVVHTAACPVTIVREPK